MSGRYKKILQNNMKMAENSFKNRQKLIIDYSLLQLISSPKMEPLPPGVPFQQTKLSRSYEYRTWPENRVNPISQSPNAKPTLESLFISLFLDLSQ